MARRDDWAAAFRHAPIGVLVLGFLLLLVGTGLSLGGTLFAISGRVQSWPVWTLLIGTGPIAIYLALQFIAGKGWAWTAVVALLLLILASSVVRALTVEGPPVAPVAEIVASLACLGYLARPRVRRAFDG